jgi:predicted PurR-regulated permease PerM
MSPDSSAFLRKLGILALFAAAMATAYQLRTILFILAFSVFLTALFSPALNAMNRWRIPDFVGILIAYAVMLLLAATVFATTLPIFAKQLVALFETVRNSADSLASAYAAGGVSALPIPGFLDPVAELFDPASALSALKENAGSVAQSVTEFLSRLGLGGVSVFHALGTGIADIALVLIFTFFLVLERHSAKAFFYRTAPATIAEFFRKREDRVVSVLSAWLRGQAILGLIIFAFTFAGLFALEFIAGIKLENRFALALIAGICEFVPYVGPLLALLPALALALGMGPEAVLGVLVLYLAIQQLENNVLVPWLMSKSLDLSPLYVLVMTMVGATLGGIL